jgi:hypothetical protein
MSRKWRIYINKE